MLAIIVGEWIVYMYLIVRMASAVSQQIFFLNLLANFKKPILLTKNTSQIIFIESGPLLYLFNWNLLTVINLKLETLNTG